MNNEALLTAYRDYEAQQRIINTRVGCLLVVFLMPAGSTLDYFVYPEMVGPFLYIRLLSSAIAGGILAFLFSDLGRRASKWLAVIVPLLPVVSIAWMIAEKEGFASPYYAGLNLVLLAVGAVLNWTLIESILATVLVLVIYLAAGLIHGTMPPAGVMFNNFYFILLMDVIVVVGTYFQARQRFREFGLRYQLESNRKALEESNQKLLALDHLKSRFFANISHELRTPLTLLIAPLETLIHRFGVRFDVQARQTLASMHTNAMRLLKLINDLLDLVRLESGRVEIHETPVSVESLLRGLASAAREVAAQKHVRLEVSIADDIGAVLTDRDKLEKIILNLQFNAIKFTPAHGRVNLRAHRDGNELIIAVEDTGVGIPSDKLSTVFDRFVQVDDSSQRRFQGAGIGLAIVREFTELLGGSVSAQSEVGKGSRFAVRLPYRPVESTADGPAIDGVPTKRSSPTEAPPTGDGWLTNLYRRADLFPAQFIPETIVPAPDFGSEDGRPTVLVADDEPDMRGFLKSQLARTYRIVEATDGQEAVEKALHLRPEVVLLDMMMPELNGLEACRELRGHAETRSIPIIMLTARADDETKLRALSAGANDYLTKPFVVAELEARVRNLAESARHERAIAAQKKALEEALAKLKETETELVQTEKMASLGRLSAGIIHEINNPLNFAATGLFTLRGKARSLAPEHQTECMEILRDVEEGLNRVKVIVSDLRAFAHHENIQTEPVNLAEAMESALRFLSHEWKDRIRIDNRLPAGLLLSANRNKLIQVLVNLLENSVDAMAHKTFGDEPPTIRIEGRTEDGRTFVSVRDNGEGIAPENLDKIFDPFFTTKDVGEGMGLGLSICYRIVQEYQGRISVRSDPGKSCEFTLEFPAVQDTIVVARTA